jgi:hypothetical protein
LEEKFLLLSTRLSCPAKPKSRKPSKPSNPLPTRQIPYYAYSAGFPILILPFGNL